MKQKRKRSPKSGFRRRLLGIILKLAIVLGIVALCFLSWLIYVTIQIGDHEYKRKMRYVGMDPDMRIPRERYDQFPQAELEFEAYKQEIMDSLDDDEIVNIEADKIYIDEIFIDHCIMGNFYLLVGSEHHFYEVAERYDNWATDKGWHLRAEDAEPEHPDQLVKERYFYEASLSRFPHPRLLVFWEPSDERPSEFGHAIYPTYYTLIVQYVDTRCHPRYLY